MVCVIQALTASEVGDWRSASATQSLPLKSLPPVAAWHFLYHFLLKRPEWVAAQQGLRQPAPQTLGPSWPDLCTGTRVCVMGSSMGLCRQILLIEVCGLEVEGLLEGPILRISRGFSGCFKVEVQKAECFT